MFTDIWAILSVVQLTVAGGYEVEHPLNKWTDRGGLIDARLGLNSRNLGQGRIVK